MAAVHQREGSEEEEMFPHEKVILPVVLKAGMATALHPVDYAKTLMQIGHEPHQPFQTKTWFGKPALGLPSVFKYIGIIRKRDGNLGLYAGLAPRLAGLGIGAVTVDTFNKYWPEEEAITFEESRMMTDEKARDRLVRDIRRGASLRLAVVVTTQPFAVVAVRTMAQFVGGDKKYEGLFGGLLETIRENGILGLWAGLFPRALGEIALEVMGASLTFVINRYLLEDKDLQAYTSHITGFIASSLVYPFTVVSNTMIVSRSGLIAGYPPFMPLYSNWQDCFRHLRSTNQLKRGSSLLFRYYTGPQVMMGDKMMVVR